MVRFGEASGDFAPQPPDAGRALDIATQAGGSAGPLPADPLFFAYPIVHSRT